MESKAASANSIGRGVSEQYRCGDPMLVLTAWTEKNQGRRFLRCPNFKETWRCNFFQWLDGPVPRQIPVKIKQQDEVIAKDKEKMKLLVRALMFMVVVNTVLVGVSMKKC